METGTQNGGRSPGLPPEPHDGGRPRPGDVRPRDDLGLQFPALSLNHSPASRGSNEYTEAPGSRPVSGEQSVQKAAQLEGLTSEEEREGFSPPEPLPDHQHTPDAATTPGPQTYARTSTGSISSGQRLLEAPSTEEAVRDTPGQSDAKTQELKLAAETEPGKHKHMCAECGRCRCWECTRPRTLPSCLLCDRRCVCSAQSVVDYGTCLCCAKCLFYHCSSDDEDVCADDPCSCGPSRRCVRWTTMGLLCPLLPCMLCYLPAKGCLKVLQGCYDSLLRPGCRCENCKSNTTQVACARR